VKKKEYPYQNLSLKDMKGEEWEDIPGLDGYYCISNYGRVKRLEFETQYRNGAIYSRKKQIIKCRVSKNPNHYKRDYTYWLVVNLRLEGKFYPFSIARLVYYCFVGHFNTDDHSLLVICKDTNNFNIRPSNLQLVSMSEKQQRTNQRGRYRSHFLNASEDFWIMMGNKARDRVSKKVTQYTPEGKKIKTFPSMVAAQKETGARASIITRSASGKGVTAGGFVWRWGNARRIDMKSFWETKRKIHRKKFGKPVTQYDLTGKRVMCYPSLQDATEAVKVSSGKISRAIKGEYKTIKGFVWKNGYGKPFINLSNYKWGTASTIETHSIKVKQYTPEGKYIRTFKSIKAAAEFIHTRRSSISAAKYAKVINGNMSLKKQQ
jgi:hypothetical protein